MPQQWFFEVGAAFSEGFSRNLFYPSSERLNVENSARESKQEDFYTTVYDYLCEGLPDKDTDLTSLPKRGDFYMDFDKSPDKHYMNDILVEVSAVKQYFISQGVHPDSIQTYDSGNKGYHLIIPKEYFTVPDATKLHESYKILATELRYKLALEYLDGQIYDARRLFRVSGTINKKGNRLKTLLDGADDIIWDVTPIIQLKLKENKQVTVKSDYHSGNIKQPIEPFMLRLLNSEPEEGTRNNTAYTIALYLKDKGYSQDEVLTIFLNSKIMLEQRELASITRSAFTSAKHFGLTDNEIAKGIMTEDEKFKFNLEDINNLLVPWNQVLANTKQYIEKFEKGQMLSYGIEPIDNYLGMIINTELVVVGGVSGIGKSEFVWNIAKANAKAGIPVAFVGLEMTPETYAMRYIRNRVGLDPAKFKMMDLSEADRTKVDATILEMQGEDQPIYFFNPKYRLDVQKLDKLMGEATGKFGIKLWIVDHLHYFPASSNKDTMTAEISAIVQGIKNMTLKYDLPIVLVAHYRKLISGTSPSLNSFKDTITIPQVADTVIALSRDLTSSQLAVQKRVEISVLKARYGMPSAHFYADFNPLNGCYTPSPDVVYGLSGTSFD